MYLGCFYIIFSSLEEHLEKLHFHGCKGTATQNYSTLQLHLAPPFGILHTICTFLTLNHLWINFHGVCSCFVSSGSGA